MHRSIAARLVLYACLALAVTWATFPIVYMVTSALKPARLVWAYPPRLLVVPTLDNFAAISTLFPNYWRHMLNSVLVTGTVTLLTLIMALLCAFAFSRLRRRWLNIPIFILVLVRMFPPVIIVIPLFPVFNSLGWLDTMMPLIVLGIAFSISIAALLLKTFVDRIPYELEEAALIDGCSRFGAFVRITVPLVMPALAAIALVVAISTWNEFMLALVFTSSEARTAPVSIALAMDNEDGVLWGAVMAMATVHMTPALLLVLLLYRQLMQVMTMGSVKG